MSPVRKALDSWGLKPIILACVVPIFILSSFVAVACNYLMAKDNDQKRIEDHIVQRRMDLVFLTNLPSLRIYLMNLKLGLKEEAAFVEEDVQQYLTNYLKNLQPPFGHTLSVVSLQGEELLRIEDGKIFAVHDHSETARYLAGFQESGLGKDLPLRELVREALDGSFVEDTLPVYSEIRNRPLGAIVYQYQIPVQHLTAHSRYVLILNLLLSGVSLFVALAIIYFALGNIIKPLNHLTKATQEMLDGDLSKAIRMEGRGETRTLAAAFEALRQRLEKQIKDLQNNTRELEAIIDFFPEATLIIDRDKRVLFWNQAIEEMTGCPREQMVGKGGLEYALPFYGEKQPVLINIAFDSAVQPQDPSNDLARYTGLRRQGNRISGTAWCPVVRGQNRLLSATASALYDDQGNVLGAIECIRDITEFYLMEQEKEQLQAQLLHAQKMEAIGTLAGGIAHDFNNLNQAIYGYTELLLMDPGTTEAVQRKLKAIKQSSERASELTRQLLVFSRKLKGELRSVDLNRQVEETYTLLQRTIPKMVDIELRLADELVMVHADPNQLEQIIMNLAINARDAMPEGGKLIIETANVHPEEKCGKQHRLTNPGSHVLLAITDTGHGMDQETLEHIYEPFFTTKETGKGTGLGLAMVYGIVKSHGGSIACTSEIGRGTRFEIALKPAPGIEEVPSGGVQTMGMGNGEVILLVDDEDLVREYGEELLTQCGYSVYAVADAETALELYRQKKDQIDLIILDMIMPGMGGKKCLEELLKINPQVRVIVASGYSPPDAEGVEMIPGAKCFISKPYRMHEMLQALYDALRGDFGPVP